MSRKRGCGRASWLCASQLRPAARIRPPSVPKPPLGLSDRPRRASRPAAAPANAAIARRHVRLKSALFRRALGASDERGLTLPACSGSAAGPAGRRETFWVHPARGELVGVVRRREPGATGRAAAARQAGSVPVSSGLWAPRARTGRRCRPAGGSGGAAGRVGRREAAWVYSTAGQPVDAVRRRRLGVPGVRQRRVGHRGCSGWQCGGDGRLAAGAAERPDAARHAGGPADADTDDQCEPRRGCLACCEGTGRRREQAVTATEAAGTGTQDVVCPGCNGRRFAAAACVAGSQRRRWQ